MRRDFDIFEKFPDGSSIWRACVPGRFEARRKIAELQECSGNGFFAVDLQAEEILPAAAASDIVPTAKAAAAK